MAHFVTLLCLCAVLSTASAGRILLQAGMDNATMAAPMTSTAPEANATAPAESNTTAPAAGAAAGSPSMGEASNTTAAAGNTSFPTIAAALQAANGSDSNITTFIAAVESAGKTACPRVRKHCTDPPATAEVLHSIAVAPNCCMHAVLIPPCC